MTDQAKRWTADCNMIYMDETMVVDDAATDDIAERLAACADLLRGVDDLDGVAVMAWVPCSERMPEPLVSVIGLTATLEQRMVYADRSEDDAPLHFLCDVGAGRINGITHWMPLPEPPKPARSETKGEVK